MKLLLSASYCEPGRSSIPFEKWMELDMQYIDQWSLWMDFKILAKTIPAVLKGAGAA